MHELTDSNDLRERPLGELLQRLSDQLSTLIRQEMELARAEMTQKAKSAGTAAGLLGGGGLFAIVAFGTLTATIIAALVTAGLPVWLSALIITVAYGIMAGILALASKKKFESAGAPVPEKTITSLKETAQWAKTQMKSDSK